MKDQYVILTGAKNNAGDFLIKSRALDLFKSLRPDRTIVDMDGWKVLDEERLNEINSSQALILTGGPAMQYQMYPGVYPLTDSLDKIKVPIFTMGVGYKDQAGTWAATNDYQFTAQTSSLLDKLSETTRLSSVRDYHTLNVLLRKGYRNYLMTGCPALYDSAYIGMNPVHKDIQSVGFSLGVSYKKSDSMRAQMKQVILALKENFKGKKFNVLFHHSIVKNNERQASFISWLEQNNIPYLDISGTSEKLMNEYKNLDLHVGYRVHAHIYMCSINKPSVLIAEDGRGTGLHKMLSGMIFKAYEIIPWNFSNKLKRKLGLLDDIFIPTPDLAENIVENLNYEIENGYPRLSVTRLTIDHHYEVMKRFIAQLP